jgi:short-subunit dehydrogenase
MSNVQKSQRPIALVTGASMGIGQDLARHFCGAGYDLVLVARSVDKLEEFSAEMQQKHGCTVWVEPADLAKPQAAQKLHAALQRKRVQIDVLVNCAGVMQQNAFEQLSSAQHLHMINLNIAGLTDMLSHFLPGMTARGSGRVLNVASIAAFQPVPMLATYAATKAYVLSLSEALAVELKGTGVTVTTLCPGITATAMVQGAMDANAKMRQIPEFLIAKADDVARLGFEACMRGDVICVPGVINRAAMIVSRGTPKWLIRAIGGALGRRA